MIQNIKVFGQNYQLETPRICPVCNVKVSVKILAQTVTPTELLNVYDIEYPALGAIFTCPECSKFFFAEYYLYDEYLQPMNVYPLAQQQPDIPEEIKDLYPDFYEIYRQALVAEANGLDKITGMAYRKAVEYLIKPYVTEISPDDKSTIEKETLFASINRIPFANIKTLAQAITWLGNDHVHLVIKHPDYGIVEIKSFIKALCLLILADKAVIKAEKIIKG